uniref:Uncharacterized protein n=1 Tax=Anopheles coluzzii TaxID=1518534 RepID=A0A8W7NZG8_ANOCL
MSASKCHRDRHTRATELMSIGAPVCRNAVGAFIVPSRAVIVPSIRLHSRAAVISSRAHFRAAIVLSSFLRPVSRAAIVRFRMHSRPDSVPSFRLHTQPAIILPGRCHLPQALQILIALHAMAPLGIEQADRFVRVIAELQYHVGAD